MTFQEGKQITLLAGTRPVAGHLHLTDVILVLWLWRWIESGARSAFDSLTGMYVVWKRLRRS